MRILRVAIVEDEPDLAEEIAWRLQQMGMQTAALGSAGAFDAHLALHPVDIVILDLGLPDEDGISVANRLSRRDDMRIVMLTARCEPDDRVEGVKAGADVYLTKPVNLDELVSVIQRLGNRLPAALDMGWKLHVSQGLLVAPGETRLALTTRECLILRCFAQAPEQTVERQVLEEAIWGYSDESTDQRLLVNMSRLRAKLRQTNDAQELIRTCWGTGYQFTESLVVMP